MLSTHDDDTGLTDTRLSMLPASPIRWHRSRSGWLMLVLALSVALGTVVVLRQITTYGSRHQQALLIFTTITGYAHRLSALEWQTAAQGALSPANASEAQETQASLAAALSTLDRLQSDAASDEVIAVGHLYGQDIAELFRLYQIGQSEQAAEWDEQHVDVSYNKLLALTRTASSVYESQALRAERLVVDGTTIVLLVAAGLLAGLFWRFEAARRRADYLHIEQQMLTLAASSLTRQVAERTAALVSSNEQLRQAKEAAEQANSAKSAFLSRMSHELRTPLNAILGFAQLLQRTSQSALDQESVEHILNGGRRLLSLINEVLDITRVESGQLALSSEPIPLDSLVNECLDLMRPLAEPAQVMLSARLDRAGLYVEADRQRLRQILLNLLSNAVKYNHPGGTVTISSASAGSHVRLSIQDTGRGIANEALPLIFEPFSRLDAEQTGVEGAGLGLAVTQRLADAMRLRIEVQSVPGQGSTFSIELPQAVQPEDRSITHQPDGQPTVLSIDTSPTRQRLLERIISHRPAVKLLTASAKEPAIRLAHQYCPQLILLYLDQMDMVESLRALRADWTTHDIRVIAIDAAIEPRHKQQLLDAGVSGFLPEPLDLDRVLMVFDQAIKAVPDTSTAWRK